MANGRAGAPKGGRVHWFLWNLPRDLKRAYTIRYDYSKHNYAMFRYPNGDERHKPIDIYIVIRTSRECFKITYYRYESNEFEQFSAPTSEKAVAAIMERYERAREEEEKKKNPMQ